LSRSVKELLLRIGLRGTGIVWQWQKIMYRIHRTASGSNLYITYTSTCLNEKLSYWVGSKRLPNRSETQYQCKSIKQPTQWFRVRSVSYRPSWISFTVTSLNLTILSTHKKRISAISTTGGSRQPTKEQSQALGRQLNRLEDFLWLAWPA
jgi:hypothetical protein